MAVSKLVSGWFLAFALALVVMGCDSASNSGGGASLDDMANTMDAEKSAKAQQEQAKQDAERTAQEAQQDAAQNPAESAPLETVTARSGKKGKTLEGGGYLSVVAGTRFWAENQMTLNVVRKNMDLYRAEHGDYPKTHEEFMKNIIELNLVKLPELPEGWEYVYDPTDPLELKMRNTGTGDPNAVQ